MSAPENPYAYPGETYEANGHVTYQQGMTLRDWFAGQAIGAIYAKHDVFQGFEAACAYAVADAMLKAREAK